MGIFTAGNVYNESTTETVDVFEDMEIEESTHEPNFRGALSIVAETEENYYNLMKAIGITELRTLEETGEVMMYESEGANSFFTKAKEFFISIGRKIKELFKAFIGRLDQVTKSDMAFVKKYEKIIKGADTSSLTSGDNAFKGYNFTIDSDSLKAMSKHMHTYLKYIGIVEKTAPVSEKDRKNLEDISKKWAENKSEYKSKLRGKCINNSDKELTSSEFKKELVKKFRNGQEEKVKLTKISVSDQLDYIAGTTLAKTIVNKAENDIERTINVAIAELNMAEKEAKRARSRKDSDDIKKNTAAYINYMSKSVEATKSKLTNIQLASGAMISAITSRRNQAKAICVRLINASGSVGSRNESTDLLSNLIFK